MARLLVLLLFSFSAFAADGLPLDIVLLLQDSANPHSQRTDFHALHQQDRIAVMTFSGKATLRIPLTLDHAKALKIARQPRGRFGLRLGSGRGENTGALWDAITDACALFADAPDPSRRRAIIVLFTDEDRSPNTNYDSVRRALDKAGASLSAAVVAREEQVASDDRSAQTPPIGGPAGKPIETRRRPLPDATARAVEKLAKEMKGSVVKDQWDLTALIEQLR